MRASAAGSAAQLGELFSSSQLCQQSGAAVHSHGGIAALLQHCSATLLRGAFGSDAASPQGAELRTHSSSAAKPLQNGISGKPTGESSAQAAQAISSSGRPAMPHTASANWDTPFVEHRRRQGRRIVAAAISGGVDSAAAASMMQQQGHEVGTQL